MPGDICNTSSRRDLLSDAGSGLSNLLVWTGGSEALGAPQPCLSSLWLLSVAFLDCLTGCQILTVDIFGNIIEQCEAVLFRQASWNYFDVFLAATGMTDIIMRVSLAQTGQFCGICSEALWLVIWFVDTFGTLAHWHIGTCSAQKASATRGLPSLHGVAFRTFYPPPLVMIVMLHRRNPVYSCLHEQHALNSKHVNHQGLASRHGGNFWRSVCVAPLSAGETGSYHQGPEICQHFLQTKKDQHLQQPDERPIAASWSTTRQKKYGGFMSFRLSPPGLQTEVHG